MNSERRNTIIHGALLVVAACCAFLVWNRKEAAVTGPARRVEVWPGTADRVSRIDWESKAKVTLEARRDRVGRYFVGTLEKNVQVLKPTPEKPGEDQQSRADAGATDRPKREVIRFVSVDAASKLAESLAPLKALRALGRLEAKQAEEFGFKEPEGTLHVTIDGKRHTLVIGGGTPGGGDRYAKDAETGLVYAIPGDLVRSLDYAESRLLERSLHDFGEKKITRVRITRGQKTRELVAVEGKRDAWADPATPLIQDETAGNWMTKLDTLGVSEFFETPPKPLGPESLVVRVDYFTGAKARGFLELYRIPGEKGQDKPDYLVRTEYLRWYAKLRQGSAEGIEQDLDSVLK